MRKETLLDSLDLFVGKFEDGSKEIHRKWIQEFIRDTSEPELLMTIAVILASDALDANEALVELRELKG